MIEWRCFNHLDKLFNTIYCNLYLLSLMVSHIFSSFFYHCTKFHICWPVRSKQKSRVEQCIVIWNWRSPHERNLLGFGPFCFDDGSEHALLSLSVGVEIRSNTVEYEFGYHSLPYFSPDSNTDPDIRGYEYKMDSSNSNSDIYSIQLKMYIMRKTPVL